MALRDLVVLLDGSERDAVQLEVAVELAMRDEAHLTGLCALDLLGPVLPSPSLGGYPQVAALQNLAQELEGLMREKARGLERGFREALRRNGLPGDWDLASGPAAEAVALRTRSADLLVVGQGDPEQPADLAARHLVAEVLLTAGRPLLLVPFAGRFPSVATQVLIGWDSSRAAARAVHDALPLLARAAKVTALTVERPWMMTEQPDLPGADLAAHLARHGVQMTTARTMTDGTISVADALLAYASDEAADLLVIGGYGHSRAREFVMGGVTREILNHMTIPVLMSH